MSFVEYLQGLAQEGETMLFVRQKANAYIATLPHKMRGEGAWYGNTGIYIVDRLDLNKPSASAGNIEYVAVMVLDDIGTKSKTPTLPPTWIMETSEGNFQWGYTLKIQPTKSEYSAAITAIAAAGYSDPGATNAVRNFRIPGSINLKPGKNNFASRLVEFHPEREYTLEEICAALEVTPGEASGSMKAVRLADDGGDEVMHWLSDNSLLLENTNAQGWAGVVCPNSKEHTDGNVMGRYNPITRSYMCFHGHCQHIDSRAFLDWVAEEGGPECETGLRPELLANVMAEVYQRCPKPAETMFSPATEIEAQQAEIARKAAARLHRDQLHDRFAYVLTNGTYFDIQERKELRREVFDSLFRHLDTRSMFGKQGRINAGVWFDENRDRRNGMVLSAITYAPGSGAICARDGETFGNKWIDGRPAGKPGDITPYLELLERVIPNELEREHLLNVFAYKRQHPEVKINHAVLLIGKPGIGKDSIFAPLLWAVGGAGSRNIHTVKEGAELVGNFDYALENEIILLNELRQPENKDRRAIENSLKPIIAAPPEYLPINRKNEHPYDALNRVLVLAGSNWDVPIALPSDDRRWFVVKSPAEKMSDEEARLLWSWYKSGGFAAIAAFFDARNVVQFNPGAAPPVTEARECMIEQGHNAAESYILDMVRERRGIFAGGVVSSPWHSLLDKLQMEAPARVPLYTQALFHALNEAGWRDCGRLHSSEFKTKKHIFAAPDVADEKSKSELRRMVEPPTGDNVRALK